MFQLIKLSKNDIPNIMDLVIELNKLDDRATQEERLSNMFDYPNYSCLGLLENDELIGVSGTWITERIYSGKQLEVDHFVISPKLRSRGLGEVFLNLIQGWAREHDCEAMELNTYVRNARSHKFYFNQGYEVLGFHFQKKILNKR